MLPCFTVRFIVIIIINSNSNNIIINNNKIVNITVSKFYVYS